MCEKTPFFTRHDLEVLAEAVVADLELLLGKIEQQGRPPTHAERVQAADHRTVLKWWAADAADCRAPVTKLSMRTEALFRRSKPVFRWADDQQ